MELTWYGKTCVRLRGKEAAACADPYTSIVGPTGRGITADIVTYSHSDDAPLPRAGGRTARDGRTVIPTSLASAFVLDVPGEYEIRNVLLIGVRSYRDDQRGAERGRNVAFSIEIDGVHLVHLGDIGHLLPEERLSELGRVDVACVPLGGALTATRAAELVAQLDPRLIVPMPTADDDRVCEEAVRRFFHEMGQGTPTPPQPKLAIVPSSLPGETTTVLLESRGKSAPS